MILTDTQDNPGDGGSSPTIEPLAVLINYNVDCGLAILVALMQPNSLISEV